MAFLKKNLIVIVLMLAVLGGAAYWIVTKGNDSGEATVTTTSQGGNQASASRGVENAELAQKLAILADLSISRDIFDDPAFQRLQPNRTEVPRPTFRNQNPFAPLGERTDRFATGTVPGLTNPVTPGSAGSSGSTVR